MKLIKNDSLQAFSVYFMTEEGAKEKRLKPGQSIVVPENYITETTKNTSEKKYFYKITNA